jgi:dUTP pyrophosphatase
MKIPVLQLDERFPLPEHAHSGDGGTDLLARHGVELEPGDRALIPTGIAVAIPLGYAGLVTPRSGLAARHGVTVLNGPGLVDSGYRGEIKVTLINLGSEPVVIERGDRIAQLVVVAVETQELLPVVELPESSRGTGGFGSTGS